VKLEELVVKVKVDAAEFDAAMERVRSITEMRHEEVQRLADNLIALADSTTRQPVPPSAPSADTDDGA
jgi:hypothetical protein